VQVFVAFGVEATCICAGLVGNVSLTETLVRLEMSFDEAESTSVKVDVAFGAMLAGVNVFVMEGAALPEITIVPEPLVLLVAEQPPPELSATVTEKI